MITASLFKNGNSQAVRLPVGFRLPGKRVIIEKTDDGILIRPLPESWEDFFQGLESFSSDFELIRDMRPPEERGGF